LTDLQVKRPASGVEIHGPFTPEWRVTLDGYEVPNVRAFVHEDGSTTLVVDGRFGTSTTEEEMGRWLPLLAHAMAVAAGYSCHGANCQPLNPYTVQVGSIVPPPPNLTIVK